MLLVWRSRYTIPHNFTHKRRANAEILFVSRHIVKTVWSNEAAITTEFGNCSAR